jgi:outer membrane protein OmpA-like peptidoglycan-associated protein
MTKLGGIWLGPLLIVGLAGCVPPAATSGADVGRYLVYFDEFSAAITEDGHKVVADAARQVRDSGARAVRIEGRASATGSAEANKRLAETRTQVVADELARDGVVPAMVQQMPIGQTGSGDPSVAERRVDIVLER